MLPYRRGIELVQLIRAQDIECVVGTFSLIHKVLRKHDYTHPSSIMQDREQSDWSCRSQLAHRLRRDSWGRVIEGSTVPHPLEQFKLFAHMGDQCDGALFPEHLTCILLKPESTDQSVISNLSRRVFQRAPLPAYTGSTTVEKKTVGIITFQKSDKGAKAAQRAIHLKNWLADEDGTLGQLLDSIAESRCNVSPQIMEGMVGEHYGGSATHRLHCMAVKYTQSPNTRANFTTWGTLSSDTMGKYSRGLLNYTILFQGAYLTMFTHLANRDILQSSSLTQDQASFHFHINCEECCAPIYDALLTTDAEVPAMPDLDFCPLVYSNVKSILQQQDWFLHSKAKWVNPGDHPEFRAQHAGSAVASILLGAHQQQTALTLLSDVRKPEQVRHDPTITIGVVLKVGLPHILEQLANLWLCLNISDIITHASSIGSKIQDGINHILLRTAFGVWDALKPIMLIPEVRDDLITHYNIMPSNVNAFFTCIGLDQVMGAILATHILKAFKQSNFLPHILCTARNFSLSNLLKIWCNAVILQCFSYSDHVLQQKVAEWKNVFDSLWTDGTFNANQWQFEWKRFALSYGLNAQGQDVEWPPLSAMSAEGWLRPEFLPVPPIPVQSSVEPWKPQPEDFTEYTKIDPVFEHRFIEFLPDREFLPVLKKRQILTDEFIGQPGPFLDKPRFPSREDHAFRLHGPYSTAQHKYLECYLRAGIKTCRSAMHLAEGAGGVALSTHKFFDTKKIIYNSLVNTTEGVSHRFINYVPPSLIGIHSGVTVVGPKFCVETGGDICALESIKYYTRILKEENDVDIITCDAETSGEFNVDIALRITEAVIEISKFANSGTWVVAKTFCQLPGLLTTQILLYNSILTDVRLYVPIFSSHESFEVFVIGKIRPGAQLRMPCETRGSSKHQEIYQTVFQLGSVRISKRSFQEDYGLTVHHLWGVCDRMQIPLNVTLALQTFCGSFFLTEYLDNLPLACYSMNATILAGIVSKLRAIGSPNLGQMRHQIKKELITRKTKLSEEFGKLAEAHFNVTLFYYLLFGLVPKDSLWDQKYTIRTQQRDVWVQHIDPAAWSQKYAKHWNKIRGWVTFRKGFLPLPFLLKTQHFMPDPGFPGFQCVDD